ncbi:rano class II histocompatibility antigen, A beta chain isoform X2 [Oncorhynchus mykiss]|uniref:rano class II histocompatibility antigen, A beta chain isoform X2 n=1 Tax=Oncorhynchus mykiss TaxID=8022 RepID=UPI0018777BF9|nr:rano class II histocompatibility antigen, A beta chain isoform X2 [Oncorhynchus mykiss]
MMACLQSYLFVVMFSFFTPTVEPSVHLRSMTAHGDRHPSMLTCSAYKFYPKQIRVTWLRNGQEVTSNMTSSEELANGDWHYQIHSYLEYTPTPGEKISCMVEHASFTEPKILHWDMSLPESERSKIAIGASGLVLGVVFAAAGLLYYNRRKTTGGDGRELVPTSHPSQ